MFTVKNVCVYMTVKTVPCFDGEDRYHGENRYRLIDGENRSHITVKTVIDYIDGENRSHITVKTVIDFLPVKTVLISR